MSRQITTADKRARIISWGAALFMALVFLLALRSMPSRVLLPGALGGRAAHVHPGERLPERIRREQSQRELPADYARRLVQQSEVLVRANLEEKLEHFRAMSDAMRENRDKLLDRIVERPLPEGAPADANDVTSAREIPRVDTRLPEHYSVDSLYELLRRVEAEIQANNVAAAAAKQALAKGLSFPETYRALQEKYAGMPSFDELVAEQATSGNAWSYDPQSNTARQLGVSNTAELNQYRALLGQAVRHAGLADSRLSALFGASRPAGAFGLGAAGQGGMSGAGTGGGLGGEGETHFELNDDTPHAPLSYYDGEKLPQELVKAQALPGRRFSENAARKGWLYINTWYMIGPWESYGRGDFAQSHPPEVSIDLDAVYHDGMVGCGVAETDADPIEVRGPVVALDGTLRWKFMQSESMHNVVPVTADHATYYAYTEIYFDEPRTMLVAIGTDDSGKLWINGKEVWQDQGTSWYKIDEHIEPFDFVQGWNRILIRLENVGGSAAGFSLLIVPQSPGAR